MLPSWSIHRQKFTRAMLTLAISKTLNSDCATPMTRQPSEASSLSTLTVGGWEDKITPIENLKAQPGYQQKTLAGVSRALDLPTDRHSPIEPSFAGAECSVHLEAPLKQLLTSLGHDNGSDLSACELELHLLQDKEDAAARIHYATDLYNKGTIERYAGYLKAVLMNMVVNSGHPVASFDIISPTEKKLLLETWNESAAEYPADRCIQRLFEDQVDKSPETIAIVHDEQALTYLELNTIAHRFACHLVNAGVKRGDFVAILLPRSIELVATQLAVLKVGAAYVPIDSKAPVDRQAFIAKDSAAVLLVTNTKAESPFALKLPLLRFDTFALLSAEADGSKVNIAESSLDTAYIMYTSGSTGIPKGVMVPHRAIARLVMNSGYADIGSDDRVAFAANPAFDASTFEIWAPLLNGGRLVVIDSDTFANPQLLAEALSRHQINTLWLTMALFNHYVYTMGPALAKLKYLLCGGEQGNLETFAALLKHGGPQHLINGYGPTETTTFATTFEALETDDQPERLPIGRPVGNTRVYVLNKQSRLVPIGVVGELYIGGDGVASGYLNRPDLTAERFLPDPFSKSEGARMYRTGDLVRYLPDGNLVFMGRNDDQVKIRGFRIELGEIEARLVEHDLVKEAVVVILGEGEEKRLVAYIVAGVQEQLAHTLRKHLAELLPEYMIPSAFVRLDVFPMTNNGKVDRRALPEPDSVSFVTRDYVVPQGEIEIALAEMWAELLKVERVGRHDNFFMLGGHSILAVRLVNRVSTLGAQLSLSTLFATPTLSAFAEVVSGKIAQEVLPQSFITPVSRDGPLELSFAQQRLWFLAQMEGVSETYHVPVALRLRGALNYVSLEKSLNTLFARHESLRTVFVTVNGQPKVKLLPADSGLSMVVHDLRNEENKETVVKQQAALDAATRFDLENGPLVRAQLFQLAEDEHIFLMNQHHIVTDGWSMGVMFGELNELYAAYSAGQPNPLAPLSVQYPDYAAWQRQWLTEGRLEEQATYWRETLAGAPVSIELPTDRLRPPQQSFAGASVPIRLDAQLTRALKALCQKHGVTMFTTVLAAWSAVLSRLSGQEDLVIGTPTANRSHPQVEQLLGFFVNTLALRIDLSGEPSAEQLLERVRKTTVAAQAHQDLPFEQVVEIAQPPRRMDQTPLFQVLFAWQNNDVGTLQHQNVKAVFENVHYDVVKFDLDLQMNEENGEVNGCLNYSTALFDRQTIERHVGYLEAMLRWMTVAVERSLGEAPILGSSEQEFLLHTWNATDRPYPDNTCIHHLFESQVKSSPEAIAIVHDDQTLTYSELNSRANVLARRLVAAGVKPGDFVLILLDRSIDLVAAQIAILKVGAAYVPIDTKAPADRQAYIASDTNAKLLITNEDSKVPVQIQVPLLRLGVQQENTRGWQDPFDSSAHSSGSSLNTAYVMYTSGSTGLPKGVMVHHRGIVRLFINNELADIGPGDCMAFASNPAFDQSTYEVWAPLLNGARIVVIDHDTFLDPHRLEEALIRYQVTFLRLTNAVIHQYAGIIGRTLSKLGYLIGAGEQGSIKGYSAVVQHGGPVCLINSYGTTETTVDVTIYTATNIIDQLDRLPIGRPISNTRMYVLDKHLNLVPIGVIGELYIGGPGVSNGYLNRPDLTAER
ncbi:hypothetical protein BGZ54_009708, partial [Gamsiella multidivaricata]